MRELLKKFPKYEGKLKAILESFLFNQKAHKEIAHLGLDKEPTKGDSAFASLLG